VGFFLIGSETKIDGSIQGEGIKEEKGAIKGEVETSHEDEEVEEERKKATG
jgi:hypothetical protein